MKRFFLTKIFQYICLDRRSFDWYNNFPKYFRNISVLCSVRLRLINHTQSPRSKCRSLRIQVMGGLLHDYLKIPRSKWFTICILRLYFVQEIWGLRLSGTPLYFNCIYTTVSYDILTQKSYILAVIHDRASSLFYL